MTTTPAGLAAEQATCYERMATRRRRRTRRGKLVQRTLLIADIAGLLLAFVATALIFGRGTRGEHSLALSAQYVLFLLSLPGWVFAAKVYELYDRDEERAEHSTVDDLVAVLHLVTVGAWVLYLGGRLTGAADPAPVKLATFWALAVVLITIGRSAGRGYCKRQRAYLQNSIIVGAGEVGQLVARKLHQHPEYGISVIGFVDSNPLEVRSDLGALRVLGGLEALPEIVTAKDVDRVVIAFSNDPTDELVEVVRILKRLDVQIDIVPRLFDAIGPNVVVHSIEGLPLIGLPSSKLLPFSRGIKRTIDIFGSLLLLTATAPLFAYAAWLIKRDSPGPILFRQRRLGQAMWEFTALKFRTMVVDTDDSTHREFIRATMSSRAALTSSGLYKLDRDDAVTRSGRWLRKTSLDELPQLINVLRGDMSLVGPRPCLRYETENFTPHHFERFLVPAGLTGLWQVSARARTTFGEALDMDVAYARNWSLALDLWLLLRTPFVMLRSKETA